MPIGFPAKMFMTFEELEEATNLLKNEYIKREAIKTRLESELKEEEKVIADCKDEISKYEKKKAVLVEASNEARNHSISVFEGVATNALKEILGDNLSVEIAVSEINGNKTLEFLVKSTYADHEVIVDPTTEDGGGVADVVSLASLIAMNSFLSDENDAPIILDEPTKFVSKGNAESVAKFLKTISEDFGKQIIMVTHDGVSSNFADKAYRVALDNNGTSQITDITSTSSNTNS